MQLVPTPVQPVYVSFTAICNRYQEIDDYVEPGQTIIVLVGAKHDLWADVQASGGHPETSIIEGAKVQSCRILVKLFSLLQAPPLLELTSHLPDQPFACLLSDLYTDFVQHSVAVTGIRIVVTPVFTLTAAAVTDIPAEPFSFRAGFTYLVLSTLLCLYACLHAKSPLVVAQ